MQKSRMQKMTVKQLEKNLHRAKSIIELIQHDMSYSDREMALYYVLGALCALDTDDDETPEVSFDMDAEIPTGAKLKIADDE